MSPSGVDRHQDLLVKPPAATTGSPGTTIFSPPPIQPPRLKPATPSSEPHNESHHALPTPPTNRKPVHDHVPVQWSFESTYGMFSGVSGATGYPPKSSRIGHTREPREGGGGGRSGSWFGRRKDKDELKSKLSSEPDRGRTDSSTHLSHPEPTPDVPSTTPSQDQEVNGKPCISTAPTLSNLQQPPSRPARSPLRQSSPTDSDGECPSSSTSLPTDTTMSDENKQWSRPSFLRSTLTTITASNLPTPYGSRAPSPTTDGNPSWPSPKLHNTAPRRPDTASPSSYRCPPSSAVAKSQLRRPATSSGISSYRDQERVTFFGETLATSDPSTSLVSHFSATIGTTSTTPPSASTMSLTQTRTSRKETPLESLNSRMRDAREKGFKMKGGKRHHPLRKEVAPYPRDYERKIIDLDRWEHAFTVRLAKRSTFYSFQTPPKKVLDLGCGSGEWVLECAREWKDTHFVGLDLVPLQPDLMRLGHGDLYRRIEWVMGNFLHTLPFEDGEFDFVHVRRIARGVPEDRWDSLFEEITRVLKKGGAFEMFEEDLFFPGSITTADDEGVDECSDEEENEAETVGKLGTTPPQTGSFVDMDKPRTSEDSLRGDVDLMQYGFRTPVQQKETIGGNKVNRTVAGRHLSNAGVKDVHNRSVTPQENRPRMSLDSWRPPSHEQTVADILSGPTDLPFDDHDDLFHPHVGPIMNPRDHSVLEAAYKELHAARFINLSPLSVLSSMLGLHFQDVRSHEPIQVLFPPLFSAKRKSCSSSSRQSLTPTPSRPTSTSLSGPDRQPAMSQRHDSSHTFTGIELRPLGMVMTRDSSRMSIKEWGLEESILNIHLSARVSEILACAEEMWELIQEAGSNPERWRNSALAALADVSKEQWEDCLARYQMDMRDKVSLGRLFSNQFGWTVPPMAPTPERKAFDEAVDKWEKQRKLRQDKLNPPHGKEKNKHAHPVSRIFRVFTARKG